MASEDFGKDLISVNNLIKKHQASSYHTRRHRYKKILLPCAHVHCIRGLPLYFCDMFESVLPLSQVLTK